MGIGARSLGFLFGTRAWKKQRNLTCIYIRRCIMDELKGMKVAILITDGFEQVEMVQPRQALNEAGTETSIVSPKSQCVCSWNFVNWGEEFPVDIPLARANASDFDALLLPGGVMNPDALRIQAPAVAFVK